MKVHTKTAAKVRAQAWARIPPEKDFDAVVQRILDAGNQVLQIDRENRRVQIMDVTQHAPLEHDPIYVTVYECDKCGAQYSSEQTAENHESQCNGVEQ